MFQPIGVPRREQWLWSLLASAPTPPAPKITLEMSSIDRPRDEERDRIVMIHDRLPPHLKRCFPNEFTKSISRRTLAACRFNRFDSTDCLTPSHRRPIMEKLTPSAKR
ncbi:hypothetical protein Q31b_21990 [Novipirellula aureliae]|uniref:Uncharacterized protein n=1 Tax=Novipirellula aureliae TaxID=2527966 RepID=A0A5C6E699_9BACT|nr:hypothetical protein Q31b_21990 [Novipirellula aureliae]